MCAGRHENRESQAFLKLEDDTQTLVILTSFEQLFKVKHGQALEVKSVIKLQRSTI